MGIAYTLCVNLTDVGNTFSQYVAGHLVAVLVAELGCLAPSPAHGGASISNGARHNTADRGRQAKYV